MNSKVRIYHEEKSIIEEKYCGVSYVPISTIILFSEPDSEIQEKVVINEEITNPDELVQNILEAYSKFSLAVAKEKAQRKIDNFQKILDYSKL